MNPSTTERRLLREETDSRLMRFAAKVWRKLFCREQWFIQFELAPLDPLQVNVARLQPIFPPADRFWADPFVVSNADGHFIFVEELPYATNRGHISVLVLSPTGELLRTQIVLQCDYHLSYPFLFRWNGDLYMMPESGENRTVDLYRCTAFPGEWEHACTLLDGIRAADATLFEQDGTWWLFVNQADDGQCIHEHLHLYHADSPLGPFIAHPHNPVKSSLRGSRPAGALFLEDEHIYRPTQDCSRVYGESVLVQEVLSLSRDRLSETPAYSIEPCELGVRRVHTLNSSREMRVIDSLRWVSRK